MAPGHFDCVAALGIAQTHESEIEVQRADQHIGKAFGNDGRVSPDPRRRDCRKGHQFSERSPQRHSVRMRLDAHLVRRGCSFANRPTLPQLEEKLIGRNEERVLLQ